MPGINPIHLQHEGFEVGKVPQRFAAVTTGSGTVTVTDKEAHAQKFSLQVAGNKSADSRTYAETKVTLLEPGDVSFYWKADSEQNADVMRFLIDGEVKECVARVGEGEAVVVSQKLKGSAAVGEGAGSSKVCCSPCRQSPRSGCESACI